MNEAAGRRSADGRATERTRGRVSAVAVTLACLAATGFAFHAVTTAERQSEKDRFARIAGAVEDAIGARLAQQAASMRAAAGLFAASRSVERLEWRAFVAQQRTALTQPGVEALCYVARVSRTHLVEWERATRADQAPDFQLLTSSPTDPSADALVFKYVEPLLNNEQLLGLDVSCSPGLVATLDAAYEPFTPLLSRHVPDCRVKGGAWTSAMYIPVRSNGKPAPGGDGPDMNIGWVAALIDVRRFLADTLAGLERGVDVDVFDGEGTDLGRLLVDADGTAARAAASGESDPAEGRRHKQTTRKPDGGRHAWTVRTSATSAWSGVENASFRWLVLVLGVAVSGLVGATVAALTRTRRLAERLAERATTHLERQAHALEQARDEAMAATRVKSEVLAAVSHEIRTPIHGVLGMTQLLLDGGLTVEQAEQARTIESSARQLLTILNDILDVSKIEAGKLHLELAPFDVRAHFEDVLDLVVPTAAEKGIELVLRVAPGTPVSWIGDVLRVKQLLLNLAGNAVKFTEQGHVIVSVWATDLAERSGVLHVSVSDTGIGIAQEQVPLLFRRFSQVDTSPSRRHGGTGLGLLICRLLVERMGGAVSVESRVGEGSTFGFSLPLDRPREESIFPALERLPGPVLVIDDSEPARAAAREALEGLRCAVREAPSAAEGLEAMRAAAAAGTPVAAAIVDLSMEGDDGFAVARAVRADPAIAETPLVLAAPATHAILAEQARAADFDGWLTKPLRARDLRDALSRLRGGRPVDGRFLTRAVLAAGRRGTGLSSSTVSPLPPTARRVLLAEDNEVNVRVARRMLERLGCTVDVASDGAKAAEMADAGAYDLIVMDCRMPGVDGYQATAQIRAREADGPRTPIVAMTADTTEVDRRRCFDAGMDDFLGKPVAMDSLRRVLDRWCGPKAGESGVHELPKVAQKPPMPSPPSPEWRP